MEKKYFYSVQEMKKLRDLCYEYSLEASSTFWECSISRLRSMCNGCGPDRWPEIFRQGLTALLPIYEPAFCVHDVDYSVLPEKTDADRRLLANMKKIFAKKYGFWWFLSPKKRLDRAAIYIVFAAVTVAGGDAYKTARGKK